MGKLEHSFYSLGDAAVKAESQLPPISPDMIRAAKARLALAGETMEQWAASNGYPPKSVYNVLSGRRACIRGESFKIAVALGLRPDLHRVDERPHAPVLPVAVPEAPYNTGADLHLGGPLR